MDMQAYCRQAPLTDPIDGRFDLVACIEVLEHIADEDARVVIPKPDWRHGYDPVSSTPRI